MKRVLLLFVSIFLLMSAGMYADIQRQVRIGYVNVEKVFDSYPDISDVKAQLKSEREKYQIEINKRKEEIASLEKAYQENFDSLTEDEKQRREAEIEYKKESLSEYIDKANQELKALKEKLVTPIYEKISTVIKRVSTEKGFSVVFRSSSQAILYVDKEFDITKDVIKRLQKEIQLDIRH